MIEAPDLKSLGSGFKSRSDCQLMLLPAPSSTSWLLAMLVNSQLICLPPVGILSLVMFIGIFIYDCFVYFGPEKPQWEVANCVYNCLVKLKPMDMRRTFL